MTLLAHHSAGDGDPVLLLNGGLMTMAAWDPIASALTKRYRVIRCDFRGQLMSPGAAPASLDGHVADVLDVLDALGVDALQVVGTSFGGLVGIALAAGAPARVRSLIAGTTTAHVSGEEWAAAMPLVDACRAAAEGSGDPGCVLDLIAPTTYSPAYLAANRALFDARRALLATLPRAYFAGAAAIVGLLRHLDLRPLLPAIDCSTLVLAAGEDRTFPLRHSRDLAAAIRGARLDVLDGAPHGVFVEDPSRVTTAVETFLAGQADTAGLRARG